MGILTRDDRIKDRTNRANQRKDVEHKSDEIIHRLTADFEGKHDEIKSRIKELQEKRKSLLEAPLTKEDFLDVTKRVLHAHKKSFLEQYVKSHLEECRNGNIYPLPEGQFSRLPDYDLPKLMLLAVSDKDIEDVVNSFTTGGLSASEREQQLGEVDQEINQLVKQLDDELEEIKSRA